MLSFLIFLYNFSWVCIYLCRHTQSEARGAMVIFWSNFSRIQTGIFSPLSSCFPLHICLCKVILYSALYSQSGSCISCLDVCLSFFLLHIDDDIYLFNLLLFCNSSLPDIFLHLTPTCVNISVLTHSLRCCRCCHHSNPGVNETTHSLSHLFVFISKPQERNPLVSQSAAVSVLPSSRMARAGQN